MTEQKKSEQKTKKNEKSDFFFVFHVAQNYAYKLSEKYIFKRKKTETALRFDNILVLADIVYVACKEKDTKYLYYKQ